MTSDATKAFMEIYFPEHRPPSWILDQPDLVWKFAKQVVIYYDKLPGLMPSRVRKMAEYRLPTYIHDNKLTYNTNSLFHHYRYSSENIEMDKQPITNMAVLCRTPCFPSYNGNNAFIYANILGVSGPTMHSTKCPDYVFYNSIRSIEQRKLAYENAMRACFHKIRTVFLSNGYERLIIHGFAGCGQSRIFMESLGLQPPKTYRKFAYQYLADLFKDKADNGWELLFNGLGDVFPTVDIQEYFGHKYARGINVPIQQLLCQLGDLDRTLIVINWNRYSIFGNGHLHDNSLAGQLGAISAISILTWPLTNQHIKFKALTQISETETTLSSI